MKDDLHSCLDGESPRYVLSPAAQAELAETEAAVDAVAASVRDVPVPDLTARVMAALPEPERSRSSAAGRLTAAAGAALGWLWSPRTVVLRPAHAFGTALALILFVGAGTAYLSQRGSSAGSTVADAAAGESALPETETAAANEAEPVYVQFRLDAPAATRVSLAGSFTRWEPRYELLEVAPGVWAALVPLEPGIHDYLFVVDGEEWVADPVARPVDDGFGGINSRLFLTSPVATL